MRAIGGFLSYFFEKEPQIVKKKNSLFSIYLICVFLLKIFNNCKGAKEYKRRDKRQHKIVRESGMFSICPFIIDLTAIWKVE